MNLGDRKTLLTMGIPLFVIVLPIVLSVGGFVFGHGAASDEPFLDVARWEGTSCVRDADWMRFHHWELLKEIRERVVRDGDRDGIKLGDCRHCHDNREKFCNQCHREANVNLDCFGCHYYPETPEDAAEPTPAPALEDEGDAHG
jgi:hypothetical protein